jgi:vesicle coat complex subunit
MAINTFQKDLSNANPNIRALAMRSLSNLRFRGREEYALPAFNNGLNDFAPSVKRSAILGLVKIAVEQIRAGQKDARDETLLSKFYELLREEDSSVVCTALEAINEVEEDGISMSRKLTFYLLSNLHRFSDLQFPVVAGYLELYDPKNDQEVMEILTALEPRLKSSNASTVLAISKVFVKLGKDNADLLAKLLKTIRKSLLSFLHHSVP